MASEKLASVVLYLLRGCEPARPSFTSLLKMIWFADYWHYQKHLATITDARYVALPRGPVIDGYEQLFDELEAAGVLTKQEVPVQGHPDQPKQEYLPAMEPDEALLSQSVRWLDNLPDDDDLAVAQKAISQPGVAAKLKEIIAA